jgi:hypothetical protein
VNGEGHCKDHHPESEQRNGADPETAVELVPGPDEEGWECKKGRKGGEKVEKRWMGAGVEGKKSEHGTY